MIDRDVCLELAYLILVILFGYFVAVCVLSVAHSMTLQITGTSTGQGVQNLSFTGDFMNVSILQNGTFQGWNVTLGANST